MYKRQGLSWQQAAAIGDGAGDVCLLKRAGLSAAMEGGSPKAIAAARYTAPPAEEDGAAQFLSQYIPVSYTHLLPFYNKDSRLVVLLKIMLKVSIRCERFKRCFGYYIFKRYFPFLFPPEIAVCTHICIVENNLAKSSKSVLNMLLVFFRINPLTHPLSSQ